MKERKRRVIERVERREDRPNQAGSRPGGAVVRAQLAVATPRGRERRRFG